MAAEQLPERLFQPAADATGAETTGAAAHPAAVAAAAVEVAAAEAVVADPLQPPPLALRLGGGPATAAHRDGRDR